MPAHSYYTNEMQKITLNTAYIDSIIYVYETLKSLL